MHAFLYNKVEVVATHLLRGELDLVGGDASV